MSELQVIGVGHGRTGTNSLQLALNILGVGPTYHMIEVFNEMNPRMHHWIDIYEQVYLPKKRGEFVDESIVRRLFNVAMKGYNSGVDAPVAFYYKELLSINPNAKYILTVRDTGDAWYDSAMATIYSISYNHNWFETIPDIVDRTAGKFMAYLRVLIWDDAMGGTMGNRAAAVAKYNERNDEIINTIPKQQLLVFNVKQGWAPLCKFLNKPVPDVPFPHVNDTADFQKRIRFRKIILPSIMLFTPLLLLAGAAFAVKKFML